MHTEDDFTSLAFHLESSFNSNQGSEPLPIISEPVFPAELLDSGFDLTNILAS